MEANAQKKAFSTNFGDGLVLPAVDGGSDGLSVQGGALREVVIDDFTKNSLRRGTGEGTSSEGGTVRSGPK